MSHLTKKDGTPSYAKTHGTVAVVIKEDLFLMIFPLNFAKGPKLSVLRCLHSVFALAGLKADLFINRAGHPTLEVPLNFAKDAQMASFAKTQAALKARMEAARPKKTTNLQKT